MKPLKQKIIYILIISIITTSCKVVSVRESDFEIIPGTIKENGSEFISEIEKKPSPKNPNARVVFSENRFYKAKTRKKVVKTYESEGFWKVIGVLSAIVGSFALFSLSAAETKIENGEDPNYLFGSQIHDRNVLLGGLGGALIGAIGEMSSSGDKISYVETGVQQFSSEFPLKNKKIEVYNSFDYVPFTTNSNGKIDLNPVDDFKMNYFKTNEPLNFSFKTDGNFLKEELRLKPSDFLFEYGLVTSDDATLKWTPTEGSLDINKLKQGEKFKLKSYYKGYRELILENKKGVTVQGWVPQEKIEVFYSSQKNIINADFEVKPKAPAMLVADSITYSDSDGNNRIDALEKSSISFRIRNAGIGDAYKLNIKVKTKEVFEGLNFSKSSFIGYLNSGEDTIVNIPIEGWANLETGTANFEIKVLESNGFDANVLKISIPTHKVISSNPQITDFQFLTGDNGIVQPMKPVTLRVLVQNTGQGKAENVVLKMKLQENVFSASDVTFKIESLDPGEKKEILFDFFTNRRFKNEKLKVLCLIEESYGLFGSEKEMSIAVNNSVNQINRVVIKSKKNKKIEIEKASFKSDVDKNLPKKKEMKENSIAVILGNSFYRNNDVPPVDFAINDAQIMKKYLVESYGFRPGNIIYIENPTQADFNSIFGTKESHKARLFNLIKPEESEVFIYYSGHGAPDIETSEGYFVPSDCNPSFVKFNGYSLNTFYKNLTKIQYKTLSVVIDACFSGGSEGGMLIKNASPVFIKVKQQLLNKPNTMIFNSSSGNQISSWYRKESHSLFTYYYLKGIQGSADSDYNEKITFFELKQYLIENVSYMARKLNNRTQTPEIIGEDNKLVFEE